MKAKKTTALLLSTAMIIGLAPNLVFAEENEDQQDVVTQTTEEAIGYDENSADDVICDAGEPDDTKCSGLTDSPEETTEFYDGEDAEVIDGDTILDSEPECYADVSWTGGSGTDSDPYYINMPVTGTENFTVPEGVNTFKIYDDGGIDNEYSNKVKAYLSFSVPEGKYSRIVGKINTENKYDTITVYDGIYSSDNIPDVIVDSFSGTDNNFELFCPGGSFTLYFKTDSSATYSGLDLTVLIADYSDISGFIASGIQSYYSYNSSLQLTDYHLKNHLGIELEDGVDYQTFITDSDGLVVNNITEKGLYYFTFNGIGNYSGSITKEFLVGVKKLIANGSVYLFEDDDEGRCLINSSSDLIRLAEYANNGGATRGKKFVQTCDISFDHITEWNDNTGTENNFPIIGNTFYKGFEGSYDGQGFTISGIRIYRPEDERVGLFGIVLSTSTVIRGIRLSDTRVVGRKKVGGIAGDLYYGCAIDCYVDNTVMVEAYEINVGGITGHSLSSGYNCLVQGCVSSATVRVTDHGYNNELGPGAGGIAGVNGEICKGNLVINSNVSCPYNAGAGAICGNTAVNKNPLNNYYIDCLVNNKSSNIGKTGKVSGSTNYTIADFEGARQGREISLKSNNVDFAGEKTIYNTSGLTLYSDNNVIGYDGKYYSGYSEIVKLGFSGEVPAGYHVKYYITDANGKSIDVDASGCFTMPSSDVYIEGASIVRDGVQAIIISSSGHGSVTCDHTGGAVYGDTVKLSFTPEEGYVLTDISVSNTEGMISIPGPNASLSATFGGCRYYAYDEMEFTQGYSDTLISVKFERIKDLLYLNVPKTGLTEVAIPSDITEFKIYDDGGKDGSYSNDSDGCLLLTAPEGYKIKVEGNAALAGWSSVVDFFEVYDGADTSADRLGLYWVKGQEGAPAYVNVTSSGNKMLLHMYTDFAGYSDGLYLKASLELADDVGVKLSGHSLSLEGDIGVNFYMELAQDIINSDTAYMQFTIPSGSKTETVEPIYVKDVTPVYSNGRYYYVFKCNVAAKEMTSVITAQMYDGDTPVGQAYDYTVQDYAQYIIDNADPQHPQYQKALPLVKAMLNYGAYAQTYFRHNTDSLANSILNSGTDVSGVNAATVNKAYSSSTENLPSGIIFKSANLELESVTIMNLYFENTTGEDIVFKLGDKVLDQKEKDGYTVVTVSGISASALGRDYTVKVLVSGDSTEYSVIFSPMNYCYNVLNRETTAVRTDALKDVIRALYLYNKAAETYISS